MAELTLDALNERFNIAFGFTPYIGISATGGNQGVKLSPQLGVPQFDSLKIEAGETEEGEAYDAFEFPFDPLISVNKAKNIKQTSVQGREGTVKEFISSQDWQVKIRGMLVGQNGNYPENDVQDLLGKLELNTSLSVVSRYLNYFDITNLVVTDFSFSALEGFEDSQPIEISAISDTDVALINAGA